MDGDKIRGGDAVNFSIGQGDTVITPLKLVQMYSAVANGGTIWQPTIGEAIETTDGKVLGRFAPKVLGKLPAKKSTLTFLQGALRQVVISGTAASTFSGFPVPVSGKTGTAEVFGLNPNGTKKGNTSWFASFGPSDKPRYAVVMMVSQGGFGSDISAVGVRHIYETLFGVVGNKVVPGKALFPTGPPTALPQNFSNDEGDNNPSEPRNYFVRTVGNAVTPSVPSIRFFLCSFGLFAIGTLLVLRRQNLGMPGSALIRSTTSNATSSTL